MTVFGGLSAVRIRTAFLEAMGNDLLGKETVLCGGLSHVVQFSCKVFSEAGHKPEITCFGVVDELKPIVDITFDGGIAKQY